MHTWIIRYLLAFLLGYSSLVFAELTAKDVEHGRNRKCVGEKNIHYSDRCPAVTKKEYLGDTNVSELSGYSRSHQKGGSVDRRIAVKLDAQKPSPLTSVVKR